MRNLLSAVICVSAGPTSAAGKQEGARLPRALAPTLNKLFREMASAIMVGQEYLRSTPGERDVQQLMGRLFPGRAQTTEFEKAEQEARCNLLRSQARQDFEEGRVVRLRGWVLAVTEARLCALAVLIWNR